MLFIVKCKNPATTDEHVRIMGYYDPAVEGSNITFGCSPGLEFTTSTCMRNGEWEPDPRERECNSMYGNICVHT